MSNCDSKPKMSRQVKDLTGMTFGRLIVVAYADLDHRGKARWRCECSCGNMTVVAGRALRCGRTASCGCLKRDVHTRHGRYTGIDQSTKEGRSLRAILQRCYDPRHPKFYLYGGRFCRPIQVCDRWRGPDGYSNFLADMGPCPGPEYSIDRIDPDGDYCPSNCRWLPLGENSARVRHDVRFKPRPVSSEFTIFANAVA